MWIDQSFPLILLVLHRCNDADHLHQDANLDEAIAQINPSQDLKIG